MRIVSTLSLLAFVAACSNSSSSGGTQSPFTGTWECTESSSLTFTVPPNTLAQTPPVENVVLSINANATGGLTTSTLTEAGASCALNYTVDGSTATMVSNQSCSGGGVTAAYTTGTAILNGSTLTVALAYSFNGAETDDGGTSQTVGGTGTASYACTKQ